VVLTTPKSKEYRILVIFYIWEKMVRCHYGALLRVLTNDGGLSLPQGAINTFTIIYIKGCTFDMTAGLWYNQGGPKTLFRRFDHDCTR
jgi:hypothetical protein